MARDPIFSAATLTEAQVEAYLARISLPPTLISQPPSLGLLSQVYLAHHEHVPKDTTRMHCNWDDWRGPSRPIQLGSSLDQMLFGTAAFRDIVGRHAGSYCWGSNPTLAALLRSLGFRVSELSSKVFKAWAGNDPEEPPRECWGTITHVVLLADWPGSDSRYLCDVGFGGDACPIPVPLRDGATVRGLNDYECWTLRHETLPYGPEDDAPIDILPGWTLYRRTGSPVLSPDLALPADISLDTPTTWTHQFHFLLSSISLRDIDLFNFYSQHHPIAAFTGFFLVTKMIPNSGGARRSLMFAERMAKGGGRRAKVHTTGGHDGKGQKGGRDVEYVSMETRPMREYLEREFGFLLV